MLLTASERTANVVEVLAVQAREGARASALVALAVVDAVAVVLAWIGVAWHRRSLAMLAVEAGQTVARRLVELVHRLVASRRVRQNGPIADQNASNVARAVVETWRGFARVPDADRAVSRLTVLVRALAVEAVLEIVADAVVLARIRAASVLRDVARVSRVALDANTNAAFHACAKLARSQIASLESLIAEGASEAGLALALE